LLEVAVASQGQVAEIVGERSENLSRNRPPTAKIVAASAFGTIIEWYDFFIYGTAAALEFGRPLFPASDPTASTLAALSVYAVGYVARPLGGIIVWAHRVIIVGHFGDRVGRKSNARPLHAADGLWILY
jgi:MFS family permease